MQHGFGEVKRKLPVNRPKMVAMPDDLLLVRDFVTVKQDATTASISFDDDQIADQRHGRDRIAAR